VKTIIEPAVRRKNSTGFCHKFKTREVLNWTELTKVYFLSFSRCTSGLGSQFFYRKRAVGLKKSPSVVLNDSLPSLNLVQSRKIDYLFGVLHLATLTPALVISVFIALVEINSST